MISTETANVVVIGGGIIGVAVAAEISRHYDDVFLLESQPRLGLGASTRNSGVIHAGIYYPEGSLKASHCVRGSRMIYEFCEAHGVPHRRIGKLIVANSEANSDAQLLALETLKQRGGDNGVEGLEIVGREFIKRLEPNLAASVGLYSPNTGIVDAEALLRTLAAIAESNGAQLLTGTRLLGAMVNDGIAVLRTQREEVATRAVVNAAGLYADEVARMFGEDRYTIYPCRGEYAEVRPSRANLVNGLIYPLPMPTGHGLGVHFTKNLSGALLLGPNARYVTDKNDYETAREPLAAFCEQARQMVPGLRLEDLRPSYSGLRARLLPEHDHSFADFVITPDRRWPFVVHTIGMESPGLTAALSIGAAVGDMIREAMR
jgi:glycerol-3-phosphate dehydrogenase